MTIVVINKSLEKYKGQNLFPEKLAKANDVYCVVRCFHLTTNALLDVIYYPLLKSGENTQLHKK